MAERRVLVCDVCGRPAEQSVTFKIGNRILAQDLCPIHVRELVRNSHAPRRGRRPGAAVLPRGAPKRRGRRPPGAKTKQATQKRSPVKRRRKRVTDPATLEKRRAGLEKARKALAKKRAAAKKAG